MLPLSGNLHVVLSCEFRAGPEVETFATNCKNSLYKETRIQRCACSASNRL